MENKSVGRYMLVFEPTYVNYQFAVTFDDSGDVKVTKVNKYTDKYYGTSNNRGVKKNTLCDIDRITTLMADKEQFFKEYIDPKIFKYSFDNLYKMFVGYKANRGMNALPVRFNNPMLYDKAQLVEGSTINDSMSVATMMKLLTDLNGNFFRYVLSKQMEYHSEGFSSVPHSVIDKVQEVRRYKTALSRGDSGVIFILEQAEKELKSNLTSYKIFRELFCLKNEYIYALDLQKQQLRADKINLEKRKSKKDSTNFWALSTNEVLPPLGEQLSLFDITNGDSPKEKKLK